VYSTILGGIIGGYRLENKEGEMVEKYGISGFFPIAEGYSVQHYDDFGDRRGYGFSRPHLGHDFIGRIGTPIVAVEGGYVEELGWNRYGGWRIGIRSHDKKRYYYYAHLRKDTPYIPDLKKGDNVFAGDVIGFLGNTGYSTKENVSNIKTPHLHFGLQIIFDESQKEGNGEIWVDVYQISKLLEKHKSTLIKDPETGQYKRKYKYEVM
jgi:murein DD-endopeptidase MepM/ murein hydrolase activator NlpD